MLFNEWQSSHWLQRDWIGPVYPLQHGFATSAAQESVCDISFLSAGSSQNSLGCASPISVQRKTDPWDPVQDQSLGTPYTWHHYHQRRTWSQEIILFLSRALWATWLVATGLRGASSHHTDGGWLSWGQQLGPKWFLSTAQARRLLEARVYSWCRIQPRVENWFQPMYTYILYSESSFPLREHSWPSNITSYSKLRGQKTP